MTQEEFIVFFAEELEISDKGSLNGNTELESIEEWDSYAVLTVMTFSDEKFSVSLTADDFKEIKTIKELMIKIGVNSD